MRSTILSLLALVLLSFMGACSGGDKPGDDNTGADSTGKTKSMPVIGFAQPFDDQTVDEARKGFIDALRESGYSEDSGTVKIIYRNAQGDQAALNQILDYFISEKVDLIGANTTVAMINAVGKTSTIPVFMMVGPSPQIAQLTKTDASGREIVPANLSGTYETLAYIDTSIALIKQILPNAKKVGTLYNNAEPNSTNALERLRARCAELGLELVPRSVTASNETQQAMQALLNDGIDVFFAPTDNILFSSFETVYSEAMKKKVPIVTSEAGLVQRGAFIGFGADFYQWGHQAGESAAKYLKTRDLASTPLEMVKVRKRMYNPKAAQELGLTPPQGFEPIQ